MKKHIIKLLLIVVAGSYLFHLLDNRFWALAIPVESLPIPVFHVTFGCIIHNIVSCSAIIFLFIIEICEALMERKNGNKIK